MGIALYGSQSHLAGLMLGCQEEIALRMQTYSHTTAIIDDLIDGGLAATIFVCGQVNSRRAEGKVHALAVTSKDRLHNWPAVKTFTGQGMPMDINGWIGWFVSANTPDPAISDLFNKVARMQQTQDYQELQKRYLLTQVSLSPEQIQTTHH
nr:MULTISPECIES: tripartite tricarboxylate transporter substrate-binding protein [Pseudomonas]